MSSTRGLRAGDIVTYDDGEVKFTATVVKVTATTKAQIRAHTYVSELFNPQTIVNTYRKYMTKH